MKLSDDDVLGIIAAPFMILFMLALLYGLVHLIKWMWAH